ncbi:MAG TPA: acyltransferase [Chitinophagaceae bacterium]|jgi:galactoside O-acetyltransferase|nr:acyltransferase [Chitinophagaceae bacterium]
MENLFFDFKDLKHCGKNVIIGKTVRIRYPELVSIGDNCIIDDFTYISTALELTTNVHISSGTKIIGGKNSFVSFGEFSTTAPNVVLSAGSDDYSDGIATPMVSLEFKANVEIGKIIIGRHCIIGSGSVVLPNVTFHDGACLGALSLVKISLEAWSLYAGIPAKKIKDRNQENILELEKKFKLSLHAK